MKHKIIKDFIQKSRQFAKNDECLMLADHLEEYIDLCSLQDTERDPLKLDNALKKFWGSFAIAAKSLGVSPDAFAAYVENTGNRPMAGIPRRLKNNKNIRA